MTANLIRRGENDQPEASPVTFVIKDNILITIRYHHPQAFPAYVKRAMKPQTTAMTGWGVLITLLEAVVDRAADHLERAGQIVDETSHKTFGAKRQPPASTSSPAPQREPPGADREHRRGGRLRLQDAREPRLHRPRRRLHAAVIDQMSDQEMKENRARISILQRDILSLTDHASFLGGKISFLLDAVLGLISIEQNGIIKIFSVAAVVFLPPTLVASIYGMNTSSCPNSTGPRLSLRHRADDPLGHPALRLFQAKGWL